MWYYIVKEEILKNYLKNIFALLGLCDVIVAIFVAFFGRLPNSTEIIALAIFQVIAFMTIWED